ncbi:MAG: polysaccharide biosynthesis tyrosine autokinase [Gaiellaceae bacterium]|jgi:capsular exopolysaccharide synthesis family protein
MNLREISVILWRRKLLLLAVIMASIAAGFGALRLMTKQYEATSTLALQPPRLGNGNNLLFFQTLDPIVSIYATAAETDTTKDLATKDLGGSLASISVSTYKSSPIMKIVARSSDPALAERSAQAVTIALIQRTSVGQVGIPGLELSQIDRPTLPSLPVFPDRKLTLAVAGLLGLGLGIGLALLWEVEGRRVRTRSDLTEAANVPVFAEIPERNMRKKNWFYALTRDPEYWSLAEALRDLRTNLIFASEEYRSILITSPEGQHGKTTVSIGLAATIASTGKRTLLVDADLHRGRIADEFGIERAPGLVDFLSGAPFAAIVRQGLLENLDLLTAGRTVASPVDLLISRLPHVLQQLEKAYEAVVIDTAPLTSVNDARIIARNANSVVLVVRANRTSHRAVREAVDRLEMISVDLTAAVLNRSRSRTPRYYGQTENALATDDTQSRTRGRPSRPK